MPKQATGNNKNPKKINFNCFFVLGLVLGLLLGWAIYPLLTYKNLNQPVDFSHETHIQTGMECKDCHSYRTDGSFTGIPSTMDCASCHSSVLGESESEKKYFENYIKLRKEVPWLVYQKQPENVFFSHAAHSLDACNKCHDFSPEQICGFCHLDMSKAKTPPVYKENKITGYSQNTMKMVECETCHAQPDHAEMSSASNSCQVCHK